MSFTPPPDNNSSSAAHQTRPIFTDDSLVPGAYRPTTTTTHGSGGGGGGYGTMPTMSQRQDSVTGGVDDPRELNAQLRAFKQQQHLLMQQQQRGGVGDYLAGSGNNSGNNSGTGNCANALCADCFEVAVTRTVIQTLSHVVGVGALCIPFAAHNASLGVTLILLVIFAIISSIADYILSCGAEMTKQFSPQSLLTIVLVGAPESMFDTPLESRNYDDGNYDDGDIDAFLGGNSGKSDKNQQQQQQHDPFAATEEEQRASGGFLSGIASSFLGSTSIFAKKHQQQQQSSSAATPNASSNFDSQHHQQHMPHSSASVTNNSGVNVSVSNYNRYNRSNNNHHRTGAGGAAGAGDGNVVLGNGTQLSGAELLREYRRCLRDVAWYRTAVFCCVDVVILVGQLAILVCFSRVIADCSVSIGRDLGFASVWTEHRALWLIIFGVFFFLTTCKRVMHESPLIAFIRVGGVAFLVLIMVIRFGTDFSSLSSNAKSNVDVIAESKEIRYFGIYPSSLAALSTLCLIFSYHVLAPTWYQQLQQSKMRSPTNKMRAAWISNGVTFLLYSICACIGYLSFGRAVTHGRYADGAVAENGGGNVLDQYSDKDGLLTAARFVVLMTFLVAFPFQSVSVRESLHRLLLVAAGRSTGVRDMTESLKVSRLVIVVESLILITLIQIVADRVPGIGLILNAAGAVSSSFTLLTLPGIVGMAIYYEVDPERDGVDDDASTVFKFETTTSQVGRTNRNDDDDDDDHGDDRNEDSQRASVVTSPTAVAPQDRDITANDSASVRRLSAAQLLVAQQQQQQQEANNNSSSSKNETRTSTQNLLLREFVDPRSSTTLASEIGVQSLFAESVLKSRRRNDFTGGFCGFHWRPSSHAMRYVSGTLFVLGVITTIGGCIATFLFLD